MVNLRYSQYTCILDRVVLLASYYQPGKELNLILIQMISQLFPKLMWSQSI
jgi:hypothetical protein